MEDFWRLGNGKVEQWQLKSRLEVDLILLSPCIYTLSQPGLFARSTEEDVNARAISLNAESRGETLVGSILAVRDRIQ